MQRRQFVATVGASAVTLLAGCTGSGQPDPPDPDADPEELLPESGDGWDQTETTDQEAEMVGADEGTQARYTGPDGGSYTIELLRWGEEGDAEDGVNTVYDNWDRALTHGVFSFAVNDSDDTGNAEELLARSSALSEGML